MSMNLKSSFVSHLSEKYPEMPRETFNELISDNLISPFQISLTSAQIAAIKHEIKGYWNLRRWGVENLNDRYESLGLTKPNNYGVCMSYDFHINPDGKPELIEINTNAAFLALGLELLDFFKMPNVAGSFDLKSLVAMFQAELSLIGATEKSVAILDENPEQQRLYIEFLLYRQLFRRHGYTCEILNITEVEKIQNYSLIYNRYTDFYLQNESSLKLKELFNRKLNFSPNPYEYFLLADKERFLDWNRQTQLPKPESLLKTYDLRHEPKDKIWSERKNLFIKPKNSYGSKQAYRAGSISRKTFDEVFNENFIAQQLSTPPEVQVQIDAKSENFKYDLRCYAYRDELQLIIARLYQGQTTNLKTLGGGFASVKSV